MTTPSQAIKEFKEVPVWKRETWSAKTFPTIDLSNVDLTDLKMTEDEANELWEEYFYNAMEGIFNSTDLDFIEDDNITIFQPQNFFPALYNKDVGLGAWIKVRTEEGWNVYWAKKAPRKRLSAEQIQRQIRTISRKSERVKQDLDTTAADCEEVLQLNKKLRVALMVNEWPADLRYVSIMKSRSKKEFILPDEYELVTDISLYIEAVKCKMNQTAVKYRSYFTAEDKDQIFYLRSRGIDKDTAILMAKLKQVYFTVNVQDLLQQAMVPVGIETKNN